MMTSQDSSFTPRYQPYIFDQYQMIDSSQWNNPSTSNNNNKNSTPPIPMRGIRNNNNSGSSNHDDISTYNESIRLSPHQQRDRDSESPNNSQEHRKSLMQMAQTNIHSYDITDDSSTAMRPIHIAPPLVSTSWFHGKISREKAELLLRPHIDGLFLVRESTNFPGDYTLCVCYQNKVEHYRIKSHHAGLYTIDDEEFFNSLEDMINHYKDDADGLCTKLVKSIAKDSSDDLCIISEQELELCEPIGKGEFCEVMLAKWKNTKVAVKVLKDSSEAEAILMKSLHHENLVNLLGIVRKKDQVYLVTEYMSKGNLIDYLRSRGRLHVTYKDQIQFAYDTCLGMEYLEQMHVVHRDLAARNVLIAENGVAKVSDFGLARNEKNANSESAKLPIKWTAPEALKYNKFSNKSDMWSFGILLWEIYSFGRVPYPRIPLADVVKHVEKGYKMESPDGCPLDVYALMLQAWDLNPDKRPTFNVAREKLFNMKMETVLL